MADELTIKGSVKFNGAGSIPAFTTGTITTTIDIAGTAAFLSGTQNIGFAAEEVLEVGSDLSTLGYVLITNLDVTNFVEVGITGSYTIKLKPGDVCLFRASGTIYCRADTAACQIQFWAFED